MKARDLRELSNDELQRQLRERSDALNAFRMQLATGVVDNVRASRNARREIARIHTILREREIQAAKGSKQ